jgi:hypothetical protein
VQRGSLYRIVDSSREWSAEGAIHSASGIDPVAQAILAVGREVDISENLRWAMVSGKSVATREEIII